MSDDKKRILLVDDEPLVLEFLRQSLRGPAADWEFSCAQRAKTAWLRLLEEPHDAVVTDVDMPDMSGLDLLAQIQNAPQTRHVPVVLVTGLVDDGLRAEALERGAADLMQKPLDARELSARLKSVLRWKSREDELKSVNRHLRETVERQSAALVRSRLNMVCRLGSAAEYRDTDTGNHVIRVGCYTRAVAAAMQVDRDTQDLLLLAAPLHDLGKIAVPDSILLKRGALNAEEWSTMQRHCVYGDQILRSRPKLLVPLMDEESGPTDLDQLSDPLLELAATIALTHHEKWDGGGYPLGLRGEQIPVASRIVAVCDVFDALTSQRPYKAAYPEAEAMKIMRNGSGGHFDPKVLAAFERVLPEIRSIRERFVDGVQVFADRVEVA